MSGDTRRLAAAGSIVAAMALIGLIDTLVIFIAAEAGLWQFHLMRALIALPVIWVVARIGGRRILPMNWHAVAARSLLVSVSMLFYFGALGFLPVGEVAAGLFTAPIFVLLISVVFLKEKVGGWRSAAAVIGFAGILLVLRPGSVAFAPVLLMPLAAGIFYALGALATRAWCANEGTLAILAAFFVMMAVWGALGCAVLTVWPQDVPAGADGFLLRGWVSPGPVLLALVAAQAVGAVLGVGLVIQGYQLAEASFVAVFEYVLLVFAAGWGWLLWGQTLDAQAVVGMALIMLSGGILARRGR